MENNRPPIPVTLLYGENDTLKPEDSWADMLGLEMEVMANYGHTLYSDEKVIKKVCLDLLNKVTKVAPASKKAV